MIRLRGCMVEYTGGGLRIRHRLKMKTGDIKMNKNMTMNTTAEKCKCFNCGIEFDIRPDKSWYCPVCKALGEGILHSGSPVVFAPKTRAQWEKIEVDAGRMEAD